MKPREESYEGSNKETLALGALTVFLPPNLPQLEWLGMTNGKFKGMAELIGGRTPRRRQQDLHYSVHGIGFQAIYEYYDEYSTEARVQGRPIVFGGSWTFRTSKPESKEHS